MTQIQATFVLSSYNDQSKLHAFLNQHIDSAREDKKPLVVRVSQKQEDRSLAQNRLYWKWLKQWSDHQGTDKDSEHLFFKRKFLAAIYFRDDVKEYRNTFKAVKELKLQKHPLYDQVANGLNELVTTTDANTAQFTEYLNDIYAFCLKQGCYLEVPDDLKWVID